MHTYRSSMFTHIQVCSLLCRALQKSSAGEGNDWAGTSSTVTASGSAESRWEQGNNLWHVSTWAVSQIHTKGKSSGFECMLLYRMKLWLHDPWLPYHGSFERVHHYTPRNANKSVGLLGDGTAEVIWWTQEQQWEGDLWPARASCQHEHLFKRR